MLIRTSIVAILAVANLAAAEPDPAAKAKLQGMADALNAAKSLSYKVTNKGEGGMLTLFSPKCDSTVLLERNPDNAKLWMFRLEGKAVMKLPGQPEQTTEFLMVGDGVHKAWKDYQAKQVIERPASSSQNGQVEMEVKSSGAEVIDPAPLAKELAWPNLTLEPPAEVDGVACDVVTVDDGSANGKDRPHRFFIAQSDHLPRRIEHWIKGGSMNDAEVWQIADIKLNGPIPPGSFAISTPEGWTFSPATPPPAPTPPSAPNTGPADAAAPAPVRHQRAVGVNPDDLAPDFELSSGTGEKVKLSSLQGGVVVLDFWGTWCVPCVKASPEMQKLVTDYKDKPVKAFGLAVRETKDEKPINYMKEGNYTYGLLLKADDVAKSYHVKAFPTYYVIGKSGEVVFSVAGYDEKTFPAIRAAVDAALEGKPIPKAEAKPAEAPAAPAKAAPATTTTDSKSGKTQTPATKAPPGKKGP